MQNLQYWIWLSKLSISPKARSVVLKEYGDPETAFASEEGSFRGKKGISANEAELLEQRDLSGVVEILDQCEHQELRVLPFSDPDYPERLRQIYAAPSVLYVKGELAQLDEIPIISVIGTRKASPYGIKMGEQLAFQISACGGTVVSLLSSGVDEAAARGALLSNRPCIGVLGTPHENCHLPIKQDILNNGVLISEYPPGMECSRHFFRERNRIAAGISNGVVVVEAPEKSGTRLFVRDAIEQGKEIFAVPGNADAENAAGTIALLKEGAKLVTCGREVMEEYVTQFPGVLSLDRSEAFPERKKEQAGDNADHTCLNGNPESAEKQKPENTVRNMEHDFREQLSKLTEDQLNIIASIDSSSTHVDDISERTGLSMARVLAQLTVLEIKGYVRREAGRRFSLNIRIEK